MYQTTYPPHFKLSQRLNSKLHPKYNDFKNKNFNLNATPTLDSNSICPPLSDECLISIINLVRKNVINSLDLTLKTSSSFEKKAKLDEENEKEENEKEEETVEEEHDSDDRNSVEKLFNFVKIPKNKKTVSFVVGETASNALLNNASFPASVDYGEGGGSDRYGYTTSRTVPRTSRDRNPELREPVEPIDQHHNHHHHHHHYHHNRESSIKRGQFTRSLSNTEPPTDEKAGKKY